jgi:BirA family biotin operon repressor/biotin-[acetyl-CoA-carboxylase] ligase
VLDWLHTTDRLLTTRSLGSAMEGYPEIDSTNARALAWAAGGAQSGALVVAEYQSAGRGRLGRRWVGGRGESLLFSVVLRPEGRVPSDHFGLLPLATGLALRDSVLGYVGGQSVDLKWPNDLLVGGKKCAGVLVESVIIPGRERWAVIGVGLNVNQRRFEAELAPQATSLRLAGGQDVPRPILLAQVLGALEDRIEQMESKAAELIAEYGSALRGIGEAVTVAQADGRVVQGTLIGIDPTGALRVSVQDQEHVFTAGEVTLSKAVPT